MIVLLPSKLIEIQDGRDRGVHGGDHLECPESRQLQPKVIALDWETDIQRMLWILATPLLRGKNCPKYDGFKRYVPWLFHPLCDLLLTNMFCCWPNLPASCL